MHVISARNVAEALPIGVQYLMDSGVREDSRAGPVLVAPGPVTTVYSHPCERVLLSEVRDANPFFHLAEILWMLGGRNDAALLNRFVADFGERFAESASGRENWEAGGRVHGAYGHRWRHALGFDQLDHVVRMLRDDGTTRQCVIQMWDARSGELGPAVDPSMEYGCDDLRGRWRDRPCNTHAYLRVREPRSLLEGEHYGRPVLDMTVCCRSNDIIWGAYGANAVHFSALLEYLAARVGVDVGTYYQISNNYHAYVSELERLEKRASLFFESPPDLPSALRDSVHYETQRLVDEPESFDGDVRFLLESYEKDATDLSLPNKFLSHTVWPALMAHRAHKKKATEHADRHLSLILSQDWRLACTEWVQRRRKL